MSAPPRCMVHGPQTHVRVYTDSGYLWAGRIDRCGGGNRIPGAWLAPHADWPGSAQRGCDVGEDARTDGIFAGAQGGQYMTALTGVGNRLMGPRGQGSWVFRFINFSGGKFRDKVRIYCDSDMDNPIGAESDRKLPWIKSRASPR